MYARSLAHGLTRLARIKAGMPDMVARTNREHLDRVRLAREVEARILMGAFGGARIEYIAGANGVAVSLFDEQGEVYGAGATALEALTDLASKVGTNMEGVG